MIIEKKLKVVDFRYDTDAQTLEIVTHEPDKFGVEQETGRVKLNKTYMFSTAIFVDQIQRRQFMHKRVLNKVKRLQNQIKAMKKKE